MITNYSYDQLSRLLSALHQVSGSTIDGASYTYDNTGNRLSKTNYQDSSVEQYAYDPLYQLSQVTRNGSVAESYTYDKVGNRLSSATVATYSHNSSNQLTSSSDGVSYTYDNDGNTATKTNASGTTQYNWDYENRLTSVNLAGGGSVTFKYDPFGRRIQISGPSGTTNYVYDGANVTAEVDNTGAAIEHYAQDLGIDEPLAMQRSGVHSFYSADGLGSISSLTTSSGALAGTSRYDAFGNLASSTGTIVNPYRYTAREYDADSGLYYYRARYYDPQIGRFLSEDPLGFGGDGTNFYAYVLNNPTALTDSFGLSAEAAKAGLCHISTTRFDGRCRLFLEKLANMHGISVAGLIAQLQTMADVSQNYLYDGPSSETPLDPDKFGNSSSAGAQTVSQWFGQNSGSIALSQQNGAAIFLNTSDWGSGWSGLFSPFSTWSGNPTAYGLGVLTHELLHKETVGSGFSHQEMTRALDAAGAPGRDLGREDISDRIGKICFIK